MATTTILGAPTAPAAATSAPSTPSAPAGGAAPAAGAAPSTPATPAAPAAADATKTTPAPATADGAKEQQKQAAQEGAKPEAKEGDQAEAKTAPPKLEVKLPDGVTPDPKLFGALEALAAKKGLKGEDLQELVDVYAARSAEIEAERVASWEQQQQTWLEEIKADKDFGGAQFEKTATYARRAFERFDPSGELSKWLNETGLGNYPELVRFGARVQAAIAEDSIAGTASSPSGSKPKSAEDVHRALYPSMFPQG